MSTARFLAPVWVLISLLLITALAALGRCMFSWREEGEACRGEWVLSGATAVLKLGSTPAAASLEMLARSLSVPGQAT